MAESLYKSLRYRACELEHRYGAHVHIVANPVALSQLSRLSSPDTVQPAANSLVTDLYRQLARTVLNCEFPLEYVERPTRMAKYSDRGVYQGQILRERTHTVSVNVARGGTLPSAVCYDLFNTLLDPSYVRQDHLFMSRTLKDGKVIGADLMDSKIGGSVQDAYVLFPDPMGATGSSLARAIDHYKRVVEGTPARIVTLNLIVTPEYIRTITTDHPDVVIYAYRLDRGLSSDDVLASVPGTFWDREVGLNEVQYIVPGAGGLGEVLNNSWV